MRFVKYILLFLIIPSCIYASEVEKVNRLNSAIQKVIELYNDKNDTLLNQYIHPDIGIYFIIKSKTQDYWLHRRLICTTPNCISEYNMPNPYRQLLLTQKINADQPYHFLNNESHIAPTEGILIDEKDIHILTNTIRKYKQNNNFKITSEELRQIWRMEANSKRIRVLQSGHVLGEGKLTFYLSYLNNNWYLSTIYFNY